jgi:hypothetical protein
MKQTTIVCIFFLALFSLFGAARPSLDGRALVADEGSLPRGLYAKAAGFLPNDRVWVTNPATGLKAEVIIVGTLEQQHGVAILLAPEAAEKLFIAKNSNTLVIVTKSSE